MKKNSYVKSEKLPPLLKYPGGKDSELHHIHDALPDLIENYYEPFLGGGAVFLSLECDKYFVNDKSKELIDFYQQIVSGNIDFFEKLNAINKNWKLISDITINHKTTLSNLYLEYYQGKINETDLNNKVMEFVLKNADEFNGLLSSDFNCDIENFILLLKKTLVRKFKRMKKISIEKGNLSNSDILDNIESAMKASFYTHLRNIFNKSTFFNISEGYYSAIYFFIRQTCYSSMFRYNKNGGFNVPYGGISYNNKNFDDSIKYFKSERLKKHFSKTTIGNLDFYDFMNKFEPQKNDFIFLDPPYDSEFSTYSNNQFDSSDQERLANYLINECKANFMLVIKNTTLISSLYPEGTKTRNGGIIKIDCFDKQYAVSFKNRNKKDVQHLVITNY